MSIYRVPFEFYHEEKVFGGYVSLRQMLYLILAISSGAILFIPINMIIKLFLFLIIFITFLTFAFLKVGPIYADKLFISLVKYLFRKKRYIYERK